MTWLVLFFFVLLLQHFLHHAQHQGPQHRRLHAVSLSVALSVFQRQELILFSSNLQMFPFFLNVAYFIGKICIYLKLEKNA